MDFAHGLRQTGRWVSATVLMAACSSGGGDAALQPAFSLRVLGNRLVDANGNTVQLRGVNVAGLEGHAIQGFSPSNPWAGATGDDTPNWKLIKTWGANTVRLPLNEASWIGAPCIDIGGSNGVVGAVVNPDPGANYRATVLRSVTDATAAGFYVILDLHWTAPANLCPFAQNPMANADNSVAFWSQVAMAFKGFENVVFEPFNEPIIDTGISETADWILLRDGGLLAEVSTGGEPEKLPLTWRAAGMQQLVDAIRATGAANVILTSGLNFSSDLRQWLAYKPTDPLNQLGAVWHSYHDAAAVFGTPEYSLPGYAPEIWTAVQGILAAGIPVVITEFGDRNAPGTPSAPFASTLLPWADLHGVSYLAWSWNTWPELEDVLIKDAAGTPSDGYGVYVKAHYLCRAVSSDCP